jgi:hypothetical protein
VPTWNGVHRYSVAAGVQPSGAHLQIESIDKVGCLPVNRLAALEAEIAEPWMLVRAAA